MLSGQTTETIRAATCAGDWRDPHSFALRLCLERSKDGTGRSIKHPFTFRLATSKLAPGDRPSTTKLCTLAVVANTNLL